VRSNYQKSCQTLAILTAAGRADRKLRLADCLGSAALIALASVGVPIGWQATLFGCLPPAALARPRWPVVFLVMFLLTVGLAHWLASRRAERLTWRIGLPLLGAWLLVQAIWWRWRASPMIAPTVAAGYLVTSVWPGWCLAMPRTRLTRARRLMVAACALFPVGAWFGFMRADGLDGAGRPIVSVRWSLETPANASPTADISPISPSTNAPETLSNDFPGFRGGVSAGTITTVRLARDWSARPTRLVWRQSIGTGWGGFSVADGRAFSHEQRGNRETVVCRDLLTGRELWADGESARFESPTTGDGPRDTPALAHGRVYALGATGWLTCLDAVTGRRHWATNVLADHHSSNLFHGLSGSPLVVGDLVLVSAGGPHGNSLAAYDCRTGNLRWSGGDDPAGYGSPQRCMLAGTSQILIFNRPGLAAHDPRTGRLLWSFAWMNSQETNCSQPVPVGDDRLLLSTGYGKGSALIKVLRSHAGNWFAEPIWTSRGLKTKFSTAVVHGGFAYGLDEGVLTCLDLSDGSRRWRAGRHGHGQLLLVGTLLLIQAESGEVVLVEASSERYREHGRLPALAGKTWNYPALAGRWLLVRNDREAACFELPLE
jgi:outer membrane protein assembly factor BamB